MKILHVIANLAPRYGGPAKAGLEMSSALARLGHEVTIFTTNQDGSGDLDVPLDRPVMKDGVTIRYFQVQQPRFWRTSLSMAKALKAEIANYDIVHIHSLYLFHGLAAGHYARKHGVPYIVRPHGTLDPVMYKRHRMRKKVMELLFEDTNIKHAAALHYTTEEEMILARPYTFDSPGFVVPNGLNMLEYRFLPQQGAFRKKYPQLSGKRMLLFFSRINFKKGLDILVEAFRIIHQQQPDTMLVLTGPDDENYGKKVREWIEAAGLSDAVLFTGMLTGEDKMAVLRDADVFVLPSYSENFGISVIEAMACGVPVVISDKVNIWREVVAGGAGKAAPCDPVPFAREVLSVLENEQQRVVMGAKGRKLVEQTYQWNEIGRSLEQEYRRIVADSNNGSSLQVLTGQI